MPEVSILRTRENRTQSQQAGIIEVYDFKLYLPSALPANITCSSQLKEYEFKLREAQAFDALEDLRQALRLRTYMYKYKDRHLTGQSANTRCQNLLKRVHKRVDAVKAKYRMARKALVILGGKLGEVGWMARLLPLSDEDVRPLRDMEPDAQKKKSKKQKALEKERGKKGEGYIELSWIWKVVGVSSDEGDENLQEGKSAHIYITVFELILTVYLALRIEWCRVRARAMRWSEEVLLLREEMRRVLAYFRWHAGWWSELAEMDRPALSNANQEGAAAYAYKQAHMRSALRARFDHLWRSSPELASMGIVPDCNTLDLQMAATSSLLDFASE